LEWGVAAPWKPFDDDVVPVGERPERSGDAAALRRGLAIAVAVLLVAGLLAAAFHQDPSSDPLPPSAGRTVSVSPDQAAGGGPLERALPGLMRFVQGARGLAYTKPVRVTLLSDRDFRRRLQAESSDSAAEDAKKLRTTAHVLEAYGLLDRGTDLVKASRSLFGSAVAGFYDTKEKVLVVRGERLTPGVRVTLVHELTHAVQDQHFDIDRSDLAKKDDEEETGLTGLVEGDAVRIERLYLDSLTDAEQKAAEAEDAAAAGGIGDVPRVLIQLVAFPYVYGPAFATAVVARGGQARLDEAFAHPPTTSEQLLHPDVFLAGQGAVEVTPPQPAAKEIDKGVLGELGLLLVLGQGSLDPQRAAAGWGGDRYVAWRDGKRTCVRTAVAMDSTTDLTELRSALVQLGSRRRLTIDSMPPDGPISFTSCG
jgi:hypothetical protein